MSVIDLGVEVTLTYAIEYYILYFIVHCWRNIILLPIHNESKYFCMLYYMCNKGNHLILNFYHIIDLIFTKAKEIYCFILKNINQIQSKCSFIPNRTQYSIYCVAEVNLLIFNLMCKKCLYISISVIKISYPPC